MTPNELKQYLPFLIPIFVIQVVLAITALIHIFRHPTYKFGNRILWIFVVMLVNTIGPIAYFVFGRNDE